MLPVGLGRSALSATAAALACFFRSAISALSAVPSSVPSLMNRWVLLAAPDLGATLKPHAFRGLRVSCARTLKQTALEGGTHHVIGDRTPVPCPS